MQIISLQDHLAQIEIEAKETFFYKNTVINFFRSDFIVIFKKKNNNIDIFTINRPGHILLKKINIIKNCKKSSIFVMNLKCSNDFVYVYVELFGNNTKEHFLLSFDKRLNKISYIQLQFEIDFALVSLFENNLFGLSLPHDYTVLTEYNKDLCIQRVLGQANNLLPYFFPNEKITDMFITEKNFVYFKMNEFHNQKQLVLMNLTNGISVMVNLYVPLFHQIKLKMNQYVYCFHSASKQLFLYDFDGNLIDGICIPIIQSQIYLMDSKKTEILLYDYNSKQIFVF
jgi:hypothetical protein